MIQTIKKLVILELVFIVLIIASLFFTDKYLPIELQNFLDIDAERELEKIEFISIATLCVLLITNIVSMFGLLGVKLWSRKVFIFSTILIFPFCLFLGPIVDHAIVYTLDSISLLIQGMILSLLMFNTEFQEAALNKSNQSDAQKARVSV